MKEALKLALEAAEDFADVIKYDNEQDDIGSKACCGVLSYHPHSESCKAKQAITAIKAALAQPAQEPDHGDELTIAYMSGVHRGKELAAQPAQEPVSVTYKEVADAMNSLWNGTLEQHQIAQQMANKKLFTTPQQRPWVGLTDAQFLEAVRLAENGNYLVAFVRIQEWLKEGNT
jgi:hypothetical protein